MSVIKALDSLRNVIVNLHHITTVYVMDLLKLGIFFISMLYVYLLDAQKLKETNAFKKSQNSPKSGVQSINLPPLCKYKKATYIKRVCLNGRCKPVKFTKLILECNIVRR